MSVVHLDEADFQKEVIESGIPVLVDFYADWCGPCVALGPTIEELAQEWKDKVKFAKVNVDRARDLAIQYGIRGIPAMFFFKSGKIFDRASGALPKVEIERYLKKLVA